MYPKGIQGGFFRYADLYLTERAYIQKIPATDVSIAAAGIFLL